MVKSLLKKLCLRLLLMLPNDRIYAFHNVSSHPAIELTSRKLDTQAFFSFIRRHGPYIPLEEMGQPKRPSGRAAVTFDDGLEDVYTIAYPFLRQENVPFTIFVLSDKLDQPGYLTTAQLLELAKDPLVTIGSHGTDHTRLGRADRDKQRHELLASKEKLEALLGRPCLFFAYPFGSYNEITLELMRGAGYRLAYAVRGRPLLPGNHSDPYTIPRLSIDDSTLVYYDH
ncbi:MAG: polysaccharide deacetylase family protein [Clostridia bacterium]|nr:polysaccharide deacetylase family protein [Clostridia bacterium]